ncbi:MAG: DUF5662 family protein [Lachnospiraceae bacterium]|nr:DUF5662 family protein [Lachnospiraceae bacterium]
MEKYLENAKGHLKVVLHHKWEVMKGCFRVGLYRQGIVHDLSKFSPVEFGAGIRHFQQGMRSPNARERELYGYSCSWMHHKGRNKHHFEYWTDVSDDKKHCLAGKKMPPRYLAEMVMDRIAASKTYKGRDYTDRTALDYLLKSSDNETMNPETYRELKKILTILAEHGERAAFHYVRKMLKRGSY